MKQTIFWRLDSDGWVVTEKLPLKKKKKPAKVNLG